MNFLCSCLHTEVPCFACLREAASAKAGHAGVGDVTVMKDSSEKIWSGQRGSDPRPSAWEADALPTELCPPDPFLKQSILKVQNIRNHQVLSREFLRDFQKSLEISDTPD